MADYIGGKPRDKRRGHLHFFAVLAVAVAAAASYVYFDCIWPQRMLGRTVNEIAALETMIDRGCADGDAACRQQLARSLRAVRENPFERALAAVLASSAVSKKIAEAHADGSISFLVAHNNAPQPTADELTEWLNDYGPAAFLEHLPLIARSRELYEAQYLKPTPTLFQLALIKALRRRELPFGASWRDYTLAARHLEWKILTADPRRSEPHGNAEIGMMKEMKRHPTYFTDEAIARITDHAMKQLTIERMEIVRDGVRRFVRDVRELPLSDDRTKIELGWLVSRDDIHPWLKRRWAGPYLKDTHLVDMWGCPLIGVRTPATGAMSLISRGSDCTEGGDSATEDIEVAISALAPKPEAVEEPAPVKKKRPQKNPNIFLLP